MADAAPVLPLPDLSAIGMRARSLALLLAEHIPTGADVRVDAVTGKILRGHDTMAVGIGPGPLSILHTLTGFTVDFSTGPTNGTTALSVRATLPTDESDIRLVVSGGPVSLAVLGVQEGAFGLVDVAHATLAGRTRLALAGDANALTFDGDWTARGLAIRDVNLASDVIRGLDVQLLAHGALTPPGNLRLEHLAATIGAIQVTLSGVLDQGPDRVAGSVHFDVPTTPCQTLLESVPTALLPALQGTGVAGTLGARGRFVFDTRSPDDLVLEYQVQDRCRLVNIAAPLARDGFRQPFEHKIYLPDGSTEEQTTGPGTPDWTALDQISPYMQVAVLTTEDGAFFRHHGFNHSAIRASIVANLKARRFVRGASTITMQLAKNLFLSRQKTLSRKLEEVVLTDYLEQAFSKDELMELYLNIIEFGPDVYGITTAAEYYFGRSPAELNLAECIFLASLLPAPLRHGAMRDAGEAPEAWMRVLRALMQSAYDRGLVSASELSEGLAEPVVFWRGGERPVRRPLVRARPRLDGRVDEVGGGISEEPDSP